ncbi:unnamed protein product [Effrenium voratum]|uniref:Uncharacterized protein n=1 Tax=Effrenium voratum TaxID=2562239 RepID=A0AA36J5N3_9DINO|nr:unnamed protein product [Effrenium voratum]CAJ1398979.1 unnamed protein product [Effrenium voratum]
MTDDFVKRTVKSREKSYIKGAVKYCERKGNEHLCKSLDKYNKKITKYYVEYEEDDESADEVEERERHEETKGTDDKVKFKRLGKQAKVDALPEGSGESEGDDGDFDKLKKFGDSLLTRCTKISDLIAQIQVEVEGCIEGLEGAIQILESEFESVEAVKADVVDLQDEEISESRGKEPIA